MSPFKFACLIFTLPLWAETGAEAWLRYAPIDDPAVRKMYDALPATLVVLGQSPLLATAPDELIRGVRGMLGRTLRVETGVPKEPAFVLGEKADIANDGFVVKVTAGNIIVAAANERGSLYGVFSLLRKIALHQPIASFSSREEPHTAVRWTNEWNNLDGTIERGYAGRSIFFENNNVRADLTRVGEYARLLASLGINGCTVNNVNANPRVISTEFLPQLVRIAEAMRPWGVAVSVSIDFSAPKSAGGLDTFDPLDARVADWWKTKVDQIYLAVPDLGGFVLKADSEGRLGPSAYNRTHADAANVIARALKPHDGVLFYRGFVYDHHMDWRNLKNDRARAAYDNFIGLDGKFEDNVFIQIKHGPIDFQVREPASPLFLALKKSHQAVELQITQEYFGQARHHVFLVPMWKTVLDFDVRGRAFVGVSNVGLDTNWTAHPLSQANLYGYGRLAWDPQLSAARIADEWSRLTYGHDPTVVSTLADLLLNSWRTFENYTGPLGAQTLTAIAGNHYGPAVESSERNGWGQWHRADEKGIGMDRTVMTGTGFIGQFPPAIAAKYESLAACPDELVLFMHHVPYTHVLHSGKTVIQHIYDTHYEGAADVEGWVGKWRGLKGRVDEQRFNEVLSRLEYQAGHVQVWRDAINSWFLKTSGIADTKGRAGHYPGRIEAEAMQLDGYQVRDVTPWEGGSGGKGVECANEKRVCSARHIFDGAAGWYDLDVQYFDLNNGISRFRVFIGAQQVDEWLAADHFPTRTIDSHSSVRRRIQGLALRPGDEIRIEGAGQGGENAPLDYIEIRHHSEER